METITSHAEEKSVSQVLAGWTCGFSRLRMPNAVAHEAIRCIIDTIGVSIAGTDSPIAQLARKLVSEQYGDGPCHVLGQSRSCSAPAAAFCNGVSAHVLDFDDVSYEGMVHASAVVWPAVLAAGEQVDATGEQVLSAFVAAVEAEYALGRAMTHDLFWRGWWTTGLLGSIGAAMGAAKVMQLDGAAMCEAINIAACQATGPYVVVGSEIKSYACGRAAEAGVQAAIAAQNGLTGPRHAFEHPHGFIAMYGHNQSAPEELGKLGARFVLETSRVTFKRYPVCSAGQSSLEALQNILSRSGLEYQDICEVQCEVIPEVAHYMAVERAFSVTEAQFCLPFCLACILRFGELTPRHLSMKVINDPAVVSAMSMINVTFSEELDRLCKQDDHYVHSARVTVVCDSGERHTELVAAPSGLPVNPMSDAQIDEKFMACASEHLGETEAKNLLDRVKSLTEMHNVRDLFRLAAV